MILGMILNNKKLLIMLIASFTSRIPTMGECIAHLKLCELLGALHNRN
jgi:hypothetical protein